MSTLAVFEQDFQRSRRLVEQAIATLSDEQFFHRPTESVNSIALIIKHLSGNLRSRWSDLLTTDGDKPDRDRDSEFVVAKEDTRDSLMAGWDRAWNTVESTLASLSAADLERRITIRGEPHTVLQALARGASHAAYHSGQILYIARMLCPDAPWLTIAPGESRQARGSYLR